MKLLMIHFPTLCVLAMMHGCGHRPEYTICLLDVSQSITPQGFQSEFVAADNLVDAMNRGDQLTLIPITGNAVSETPGHVFTITAPVTRQPYDYDLIQFRAEARAQIDRLRAEFVKRPAKRTDILGALAIARDELESNSEDENSASVIRTLYVLSDFVQDDGTYRFGSEARMTKNDEAAELARRLRAERNVVFPASLRVRLIELESGELASLRPGRVRWIRAFWDAYLAPIKPQWTPIGTAAH